MSTTGINAETKEAPVPPDPGQALMVVPAGPNQDDIPDDSWSLDGLRQYALARLRGCPKRKRGDKMKGRKDFCERITRYNSWFSHREKRTKRT